MTSLLLALALQLPIPVPTGYVNDFARAIQPSQAAAMTRIVDEVRQKSGGEIVVVTLADLGDRAAIDVARDIGRQWQVGARGAAGDPRRNTGVVLLLKPGQRPGDGQAEVAIASGSGAEGFVTDALAGRVRDAIGREAVAAGNYGAGLLVGTQLLAGAYAREFGFELTGAPAAEARGRRGAPQQLPWPVVLLIVIGALVFLSRARRRGSLAQAILWNVLLNSGRGGRGGRHGGWGGGGGGFGGFGGGGGFSGGGASGRF